ncbi:MAG: HlyD family efflux transporter periplasmic adaptor subunit [Desulfovibrio sp.]|jgi:multidrug resistance efflux pump|nr:HlyD family efflux transporter periplasmic adaptor subunit [Desulfovibrio sp.]
MKPSLPKPPPSLPYPGKILAAAGILLLAGAVLYWLHADQISLTGQVSGAAIALGPAIAGVVDQIPAEAGQAVRAGEPMLHLKDDALRETLAWERQTLDRLEADLPPALRSSLARATPGLEQRLAHGRQAEEKALSLVGEASAAAAGAAVAARRASILRAEGKITEQACLEAQLAHARAQKTLEEIRAEYENLSLARAAVSAELRELRDMTRNYGLNLQNYEEQRDRTRAAEETAEAALLRAPEDGIVAAVTARTGDSLQAGQTALYFLPLTASPAVIATVPSEIAAHLAPGQECRLSIASLPSALKGAIDSLDPLPPAEETQTEALPAQNVRVSIRIHPEEGPEGTDVRLPPLMNGATAVITIYLR